MTAIEKLEAKLNHIYESCGYKRFQMSRFEPYDLYVQNRDFLQSEKIITFTDAGGRLMALRPDVTLSVIKNSDACGERVYYNEAVYRAKGDSYREIRQSGVECIGRLDALCMAEMAAMAAQSLHAVSPNAMLSLSDVSFVNELLNQMQPRPAVRAGLLNCIASKNVAGILHYADQGEITQGNAKTLQKLLEICQPLREGVRTAAQLAPNKTALSVLVGLSQLADLLEQFGALDGVFLDFSLVNSMDYYNGLIFQGFVSGIPFSVLSGGCYSLLAQKMGKAAGAIGFAVYLDRLEAYLPVEQRPDADLLLTYKQDDDLCKLAGVLAKLRKAGIRIRCMREDERKEQREAPDCSRTLSFAALGEAEIAALCKEANAHG